MMTLIDWQLAQGLQRWNGGELVNGILPLCIDDDET
jgi:hypothetical protein